ncbi:MAG TPA: sterol desaturase family protein [Aquabacterium sp.]|uniref:sterol desaturase family protein n=1 Tax=Aquabacterium sp. TaxID=1872578 RepID=UPI002E34422F|nr:sterol desaturase family protein [Aquabacterium sp.]HEX5373908.1 sterol desaturase family protein [Aquabacterium sp.]
MRKLMLSWAFIGIAVALGIWATVVLDYDQNKVVMYFLVPYFALATLMQYIWPEQPNQFEKGEVLTDIYNNIGLLVVTAMQGGLVHLMSSAGAGLLFQHGIVDDRFAAHHLPFWAQVLVAWWVFDFMFYVTHRMAHEVDWFWRFHSVHHCAHRLSFLNASRVHPVDLVWRRLVPLFVAYQTGVTPEAIIVANTIGATLAAITHMNVDFNFGPLNYLIGTNQIHRWHHSDKIEEAKNFSVVMLWDHLFGTFVYPAGRTRPAKMGLFNELYYPLHNYWGQLIIPFTWKRWKARQAAAEQQQLPPQASASVGTVPAQGSAHPAA